MTHSLLQSKNLGRPPQAASLSKKRARLPRHRRRHAGLKMAHMTGTLCAAGGPPRWPSAPVAFTQERRPMQYSKFNLGRVHESLAFSRMQRSLHSVQQLFPPKSRTEYSAYPTHSPYPVRPHANAWLHASTRQPHTRVGYAAIPNAISIVQDENQLAGAERLG